MNILNRLEHNDANLLKILNSSLKCKPLDVIMPLVTRLVSNYFLILFCTLSILSPNLLTHNLGVKCAVSIVSSTLVAQILKKTISRRRPFLSISNLNIKKIGIDKYSFPSGHSTTAFAIGVMISLFYPSIALIPIILASLIGFSRIYLGVHYPSDVLVGVLLGSVTSYLVFYLT
ncbi:phosphatase PAP2 family protein [Clostridium sp. DJ247]|uniref:phosphatase PAP2 family protein n=1 Tax=Clostridium sp. DJ247 TaxID=2726188 RepID=UPI001628E9E0|nr:phosphatase PAP2 family protein [Clostridium sp. DJ247]MBC2581788.1 phosphatase PAP2 family protein [Clostridium sp. DJ247]